MGVVPAGTAPPATRPAWCTVGRPCQALPIRLGATPHSPSLPGCGLQRWLPGAQAWETDRATGHRDLGSWGAAGAPPEEEPAGKHERAKLWSLETQNAQSQERG